MFAWRAYPERASAGAGAFLAPPVLARSGIHAAFTGRGGGFSKAPYASLNLSYVSGDDPDIVRANRDRALGAIGLDRSAWTGGRQIHGANVVRITASECGAGAEGPEDTIAGTDALWTDEPGIAIVVLVADCVPILLADPVRRRIAVVHAGRRGLMAGVIGKAAAVFDDPTAIVALIGPSIGPCCYEVGGDIAAEAKQVFGDGIMRGRNLDLWAGVAAALREARVGDAVFADLCTRCESHRFFSHRAGDSGRQGIVACLA